MSTPKVGEHRLYRAEEGWVLIRITNVLNNDLARYFNGECVLTGKTHCGGLYTEEDFGRYSEPMVEMEVIAWLAK
jgi:hypothetical protein